MFEKTKTIWKLLAGERATYLGAVVALILASAGLYLSPLVARRAIDGLLEGSVAAGDLWIPAAAIVALTAVAGGLTHLQGRWSAVASERIVRRVRDRLYDHIQRLPCSTLDRASTGDLIQRCTSDVDTLRQFLSRQIVEIGRATVMIVVPIPWMLAIDARMTLAAMVFVPVLLVYSVVAFRKVKKAFGEVDEAEGAMTTTIQENLTGIRVVRAFNRQAFEAEKLAVTNAAHRDLEQRLFRLLAHFWSLSDLICWTQRGLVVAVGAWFLATGSLSIGSYFFFLSAVALFIWPVQMMGRILSDLGKATVALDRIGEILAEPAESSPLAPATLGSIAGDIRFEGVTFHHGQPTPVLDDVSFRIGAGQTLALVGPSGSGKSTIVNLLLRLYDPDAGTIEVDGVDLSTTGREAIRRQVAVGLQEPFLYSRTIRQNLEMAHPTASEERLHEATRAAAIHRSIVDFEEGYETLVGERGVTLSGGQRQRLSLARALLRDPAILILDDALSAVDVGTESVILDALERRRGRHTTIVIAHRLSTLLHADRILVLDSGRVVQEGDHQTLVSRPGLYRRLWRIQGPVESAG